MVKYPHPWVWHKCYSIHNSTYLGTATTQLSYRLGWV